MSKSAKIIGIVLVLAAIVLIALYFLFGKTPEYTIKFDTNGGSLVQDQIVKKGEKVIKPSNPTRDGYTFVTWQYQNKEYDFNTDVISDMTIEAKWEVVEEINKYDIIFTVDGQTKTISVSEAGEIDLDSLGFEEKPGYVIKWYVDGEEYDFEKPITANMTIEGKYEKTSSYTVKFNSNGGSSVPNQTVNANGKAKEPTNVTRYGYTLDGWYLDNKKYDFSTPVTKNITLKAQWSEDTSVPRYEVKFDSNGGSKVSSQKVLENEKAKEPSKPTRKDYSFDGWYLGNNKYTFKEKVTKDITLTAKWRALEKYTVTFNSNGGTSVPSQVVIEGEKAKEPNNPTKTNSIFKGWKLNGTLYKFTEKVTKNITLVAEWEDATPKPKYTVTFNSNGGTSVKDQLITEGEKATEPNKPTRSGYNFDGWYLGNSKYTFTEKVTKDITLVAHWTETASEYTVTATRVDNYSPDSTLKVYKNSSQVSFRCIKFTDGILVDGSTTCPNSSRNSMVARTDDIKGETSFLVVLADGTQVKAKLK